LQDPPKYTRIWIFCLKTNHLATLLPTAFCGLITLKYFRQLQIIHTSIFNEVKEHKNIVKVSVPSGVDVMIYSPKTLAFLTQITAI
jgi:hypothetical protein